jgi:hypothetical protein
MVYTDYLRSKLGMLKWHLAEVWPSELRARRSVRLRGYYSAALSDLPPIAGDGPGDAIDVHMLCGEGSSDMGMWSSWSLLRFLPRARFYVHCDGTLKPSTVEQWRELIPDLHYISSADADRRVQEVLAQSCPQLLAWRERMLSARQNIDYFLFGEREKILSLDSDVLCFREPTEVIAGSQNSSRRALWMQDAMYAYSIPADEFASRYGSEVPTRVNGGFWLAPRLQLADWVQMQADLLSWPLDWQNIWWSQQTLLAVTFSRLGGHALDPMRYFLERGKHRPEMILRHYPSPNSFRPRFFTEGIAALRAAPN